MYISPVILVVFLNVFMVSLTSAGTVNNSHARMSSAIKKELDIVYYRDFPYKKQSDHQPADGCFFRHGTLPASDPSSMSVLQCREEARLLLPATTVDYLQREQARNGYIKVNLSESRVHAEKAIITAVIPVSAARLKRLSLQKKTDMVTGIFIRHSTDVRQYQFINERTKNISTINVTGNHRFYVKNRRAFIAVKNILPEDQLISATGDTIRVLCPIHTAGGCYQPYQQGRPIRVYNMEAGRRHIYFVSNTEVLVHNCGRINITEYYDKKETAIRYRGQIDAQTREYDGFGQLFDENGLEIYRGEFHDGKYHKYGSLYHAGSKQLDYVGEFKFGEKNGHGIEFSDPSSEQYVLYRGIFDKNERSFYGLEYHKKAGKKYEGQWFRGKLTGLGVEYYESGHMKYQGIWCDGFPYGQGTMYFPDGKTERFEGIWIGGYHALDSEKNTHEVWIKHNREEIRL